MVSRAWSWSRTCSQNVEGPNEIKPWLLSHSSGQNGVNKATYLRCDGIFLTT